MVTKAQRRPSGSAILQVRIELRGTKPTVWRRVLVSQDGHAAADAQAGLGGDSGCGLSVALHLLFGRTSFAPALEFSSLSKAVIEQRIDTPAVVSNFRYPSWFHRWDRPELDSGCIGLCISELSDGRFPGALTSRLVYRRFPPASFQGCSHGLAVWWKAAQAPA